MQRETKGKWGVRYRVLPRIVATWLYLRRISGWRWKLKGIAVLWTRHHAWRGEDGTLWLHGRAIHDAWRCPVCISRVPVGARGLLQQREWPPTVSRIPPYLETIGGGHV